MKKFLTLLLTISAAAFGQMGDIEQQYSSQISVIANPGFENGLSRWEKTGSSTLVTTSSGTNRYLGAVSAIWDPSATGEYLRSRLSGAAIPRGLANQACEASFYYLWDSGSDGDITLAVNDGTTGLVGPVDLTQTAGDYRRAQVYFDCPSQGTTIRVELESTADAAAVTIDGFHVGSRLGVSTNVLPVVYEESDTRTNLGATGTLTHSKNIPAPDQSWIAIVEQDGAETLILDNGWITDMDANTVDYDITGLAGADVVTFKLMDTRQNSNFSANLGINFTYGPASSAPAGTLPHGLGVVPRAVVVQHEGATTSGQWDILDSASYCSVDAVNVYCDFTGTTIDATHRIFIGLSTSTNPSFLASTLDLVDLTVDTLTVNQSADITGLTTTDSTVLAGSGTAPSGGGLITAGTVGNGGPLIQQVVGSQTAYCHNIRYDSGWKSVTSGEMACIRMDNGTGGITWHIGSAAGADETQANWDTTDVKMHLDSTTGLEVGRVPRTSAECGIDKDICGGSFAAVVTSISNLDATPTINGGECFYTKLGTTVNMTCSSNIDATTADSSTVFEVTLPIASNFTSPTQLIVVGSHGFSGASASASIGGDANTSNDKARVSLHPVSASNLAGNYTITYEIQ